MKSLGGFWTVTKVETVVLVGETTTEERGQGGFDIERGDGVVCGRLGTMDDKRRGVMNQFDSTFKGYRPDF